MAESFATFFRERIDSVPASCFTLSELRRFPEADWLPLVDSGVLRRMPDPPEDLCLPDGRCVSVRRAGDRFFGVAEDGESALVPLHADDVTAFAFAPERFADCVRAFNHVDGRTVRQEPRGLLALGRRRFSDTETASVWLLLGAGGDPARLVDRLSVLARMPGRAMHVVVFPCDPLLPVADEEALAAAQVQVATLGRAPFEIEWPIALQDRAGRTKPNYGLIHEGRTWRVHFLGEDFTVDAHRGVELLARLLADPSATWTPLELEQGFRVSVRSTLARSESEGLSVGDAIEAPLELATRSDVVALRERSRELTRARDRAVEEGRELEAEEAERELAALRAHASKLVGRGGRSRVEGAPEKARKNVSKHLRAALAAIQEENNAVAAHLGDRLQIGNKLTYTPEAGEVWTVRFPKEN